MDRDEALRLLRGGSEGIEEWNQRRRAGEAIPDLTGADLGEADLTRATLDVTAGEKTWRGSAADGRREVVAPLASLTASGPRGRFRSPQANPRDHSTRRVWVRREFPLPRNCHV